MSEETFLGEPLAEDGTPKWHEMRLMGIGASEAAAAAGVGQYMTALELYHTKRSAIGREETDAMWWGSEIQPLLAKRFEIVTGIEVRTTPCGLYAHEEHPEILATPDGELVNWGELLELKEMNPDYARVLKVHHGMPLPDECADWHCQAQQQMSVTGASLVRFGVKIGYKVSHLVVERDEEMIDMLKEAVIDLWRRIRDGDPPDPDYEHRTTLDLQKKLYGRVDGVRVLAERDEDLKLMTAYLQAIEMEKDLKKRKEVLQARVRARLENHYALVGPDGTELRRVAMPEKPERTIHLRATPGHVQLRVCKTPKDAEVLTHEQELELISPERRIAEHRSDHD